MENPTTEALVPLAEKILVHISNLLGVDLGDFDEEEFNIECLNIAAMIAQELLHYW
jgi:hypothetical protein